MGRQYRDGAGIRDRGQSIDIGTDRRYVDG